MEVGSLQLQVREVMRQCEFAIEAVQGMNGFLSGSAGSAASGGVTVTAFWSHSQNFVLAAGLLADLFGAQVRGWDRESKALRHYFGVAGDLHLKAFVAFYRDYGSQLENWSVEAAGGMVVDATVMPYEKVLASYGSAARFLRLFDPVTFKLYYLDTELDVQAAVDELVGFYKVGLEKLNSGFVR